MNIAETDTMVAVTISPIVAQSWLDNKNGRNRSISQKAVEKFARDMENGHWDFRFKNPIRFGESGQLLDGQHRLAAIVESGVSGLFWVEYGVPDDAQLAMDCGAKRTVAQFEQIAHPGEGFNKNVTACAVAMGRGFGSDQNRTHAEQHQFIERHKTAILFACGLFPKTIRGVTAAPTKAVLARGWYHTDAQELRDFASVLKTENDELPYHYRTAQTLKRVLESTTGKGGHDLKLKYLQTERALQGFLRREGIKVLRVAKNPVELFPLPEESE